MSSCSHHPCSCTKGLSLLPSRVLCALRCFLQCLLGSIVEAIAEFFYLKESKPCQDLSSAVVSLPSWRSAPLERLSQIKDTAFHSHQEAWWGLELSTCCWVASALKAVWNVRTLRWNSLEQKPLGHTYLEYHLWQQNGLVWNKRKKTNCKNHFVWAPGQKYEVISICKFSSLLITYSRRFSDPIVIPGWLSIFFLTPENILPIFIWPLPWGSHTLSCFIADSCQTHLVHRGFVS